MGTDRDEMIFERRQAGEKGIALAKEFGLSEGRISQIYSKVRKEKQLQRCDTPEEETKDESVNL